MNCLYPYIAPGRKAFGCGQCLPCRINRRRVWTHRIILESYQHERNSFATLTYAECDNQRSLNPRHVQLFIKRLRRRVSRQGIRYFVVGEYGDRTWRPHYHAALFGFGPCDGYRPSRQKDGGVICLCSSCSTLRETWGLGHTMLGDLNPVSAQYMAGYVTKKLTNPSDPLLEGRYPEFSRMSLKPGIGAAATWDAASAVLEHGAFPLGDVPHALTHGKKIMPLGRYLTKLLRLRSGMNSTAPEGVTNAFDQEMQALYDSPEVAHAPPSVKSTLVRGIIGKSNEQKARNQMAKLTLNKRKTI